MISAPSLESRERRPEELKKVDKITKNEHLLAMG
jgi:hypothetical protein